MFILAWWKKLLVAASMGAALFPALTSAATLTGVSPQGDTYQGHAFTIKDSSTDVADLGNGRTIMRVWQNPRLLTTNEQGALVERPAGWNLFAETAQSRLGQTLQAGYSYTVPVGDSTIVVSSGNATINDSEKTFHPLISTVVPTTAGSATVNTFQNVYPDTSIRFTDKGARREREIVLNKLPGGVTDGDTLYFWESYTLPEGAKLADFDGVEIANGREVAHMPLFIRMPSGASLAISGAAVHDSSGRETLWQDLTQKILYDTAAHTVSIGLMVPGAYLLQPDLVWPVTIDPQMHVCDFAYQQANGPYTFPCNSVYDMYIRIQEGNIADSLTDLFVGYYKTAPGATRMTVLKFIGTSFPSWNDLGTVQTATLSVRLDRLGLGTFNGAIPIVVRKITTPWNVGDNLSYNTIRAGLVTQSTTNVNTGAVATRYTWDVFNAVSSWVAGNANYGFEMEGSPAWNGVGNPAWVDRLLIFSSGDSVNANGAYLLVDLLMPDLVGQNYSLGANNIIAGQNVQTNLTVKNVGGNSNLNKQSTLAYYLNPLANCNGKVTKIGTATVPLLTTNATSFQSFSVTIPANTAAGNYCVQYAVDDNDVILEDSAGEQNNTGTIQVSVSVPAKPDLLFSSASLVLANVQAGGTATMNTTVKNVGGANSAATIIYYYFDGAQVNGQTNVPPLAVGATFSSSFNYTVPANKPLGSYAFVAQVDPFDDIGESTFSNNNSPVQTVNVVGAVDFVASNFTITDTKLRYAGRGDTLAVSGRVQNIGSVAGNNVAYTLALKDANSGALFFLTNLSPATLNNLNVGYDQNISLSGTVPANMPYTGTYKVVVTLNTGGIVEANQNNNSATTANTVVVQQYNIGGGGGGGGGGAGDKCPNGLLKNTDADCDGFLDIEEKVAGPNPNGAQSVSLYDVTNVKAKKASVADNPPAQKVVTTPAPNLTMVTAASTPNHVGDPVNARTGGLELTQSDFALPGRGQYIDFSRTYNSVTPDLSARFGNGWTNSYDMFYYQDAATHNVQVYLGGALTAVFSTNDGGATFVAPAGYSAQLKKIANGFEYVTLEGVHYVFTVPLSAEMGLLDHITDPNNNTTSFTYNTVRGIPLLSKITDASNRSIAFSYPAPEDPLWDKVTQLIDTTVGEAAARLVRYSYDAKGNLLTAASRRVYAGATEWATSTYTYDGTNHMLTYETPRGTILYNDYNQNGNGQVVAQYEYNPRVDAPGAKRLVYTFTYSGADGAVAGSTHCTVTKNFRDANTSYSDKQCFNASELKIYQADGLGNAEKWAYDGNGQLSSYTDKNGAVTGYTFDGNRRLTFKSFPDTAGWHTEEAFTYDPQFNRILTDTQTTWPLANPAKKTVRTTTYTIDPSGNIKTITDPEGNAESYIYYANGNVSAYTKKGGQVIQYQYDLNGNYVDIETADVIMADGTFMGVVNGTLHDGYGNVIQKTNGLGQNTTQYYYDSAGNLRQEKNVYGDSKFYTYDATGHRITTTDELGHLSRSTYDTDLNASLLKVERVGLQHTIVNSRTYDFSGNLSTQTDGNKNVTTINYDAANRVYQKIDPLNTVTYTYYPDGRVQSETTSRGGKTVYFYDSRGFETERRLYKDANTYITIATVRDGFNRPVTVTDGNGNVTTYTYDKNDHVLTMTDALGGLTTYRYDRDGNRIGVRTPRAEADASLRNASGDSTTNVYDGFGRVIKSTDALNHLSSTFYDENGSVVKTVDRQSQNGSNATHISLSTYDKLFRLKTVTYADTSGVSYDYDKAGNRTSKTDQVGRVWGFGYDDFNRLTSETDPLLNQTGYGLDDNGNKILVTLPDNSTIRYQYTEANKVKKITDSQNNFESFTYDSDGNKKSFTNKLSRTTNYTYDLLNRLETETDAANTLSRYTYDSNNNRRSATVGTRVTGYTYDELNRLKVTTYPTGKTESRTYDADSNIKTFTDGKNQVTTYTYDANEQLLTKQLPGNVVTTYTRDNWGNTLSVDGPTETVVSSFDLLNRPTSAKHTIKDLAKDYTVATDYATDGQIKAVTDAAGKKVDYIYDGRGKLDSVKLGNTVLAGYTYTALGKPDTITFGNGVLATIGYDGLGRPNDALVKDAKGVAQFHQAYTYDAENNRTKVVDNGTSTTTYQYDVLDQITGVDYEQLNGVGKDLGFTYDDNGNRQVATTPYATMAYGYTANTNQQTSVNYNNNRLVVSSQYDGNGSLTKETYTRLGKADKEAVYSWDAENRLVGITYNYLNRPVYMPALPANSMAFAYDDVGNRIKKTVNGTDSYYVNNGLSVLNELDKDGGVTKSIVAGLGEVAEIDKNGTITYVHQDLLGSTVLLTKQDGTVASRYEYDPFGQMIGADVTTQTKYLFTNQEFDPESNLYYYNARYYNPTLGRFISRDPLVGRRDDTLGYNEYAYVRNNPLKYVDPTGMEEITNDFIAKLNANGKEMRKEDLLDTRAYEEAMSQAQDIPWWLPIQKKLAEQYAVSVYELGRVDTYIDFFNHVKPGGDWDYKLEDRKKYGATASIPLAGVNDDRIKYDAMGNINFGFTGAAAGISSLMLKSGAGAAQIYVGTSNIQWYGSYFDDPVDQIMINVGIDLYQNYGTNINSQKLKKALDWELGSQFILAPGSNYWDVK